jgi:hypothetical protein
VVFEDAVHLIDVPLLDVVGMEIRQIEEPLREMADDRRFVEELLIVEFLGKHLLLRRGTDQGALIGEGELLFVDPNPGLWEQTRLAALLHIEEKDAGVDVIGIKQELAIMVPCRRILNPFHILLIEKVNVAVKENVTIQIQQLIAIDFRNEVGKQTEKGIRRAISAFVGGTPHLFFVKSGDVDLFDDVIFAIMLGHLIQEGDELIRDRGVRLFVTGEVHREDEKTETVFAGTLKDGKHAGEDAIEDA